MNDFENVVNRRVDIREDIKHYQDTLSYASSKVDYSVGQNIYMLPSNMNLKIKTGTVGYNNKILVSDEKFSLGKTSLEPAKAMGSHSNPIALEPSIKSYKVLAKQTQAKKPTTHEDEKIALVLFLAGGFAIWNFFDETRK